MGSAIENVVDLGFLEPPEEKIPLEQYAHVYGECYLVPYPPEGCWMGYLRVYRRDGGGVVAEAEFTAGEWRKIMTRKERTAAKRAAGWCTVEAQRIMLSRANEDLGGGLFVKPPPDPSAPRITGTLSIMEPRSRQ